MSAEAAAEAKTYGSLPSPLQDGEIVLQLCHRHRWYLWPRTVLWVVFAFAPVIVLALVFDAERQRLGGAPGTATTIV